MTAGDQTGNVAKAWFGLRLMTGSSTRVRVPSDGLEPRSWVDALRETN